MREVKRKNRIPKPSALDRAIVSVFPTYGTKRYRGKVALAMAESYTGASKKRRSLSQWFTSAGDADSDILSDLPDLRERSRDLMRNNPLACGAIKTKVTSVVGSGLTLQARINRDILNISEKTADDWERKTEAEWLLWSESKDCDIERQSNFREIQNLSFLSTLENGDCFVLTPTKKRKNNPYDLRVQLVEADRITNKDNSTDTETLAGGIERESDGAIKNVHILKGHPGNLYSKQNEWQVVPFFGKKTGRRNVLHLYNKIRIGQSRGVPDLAPVMEPLKQLGRYTDAEIDAAVISSFFTVFIKSETGDGLDLSSMSDETGAKTTDDDYKLGPASILDMGVDEGVEFANPTRPNQAFDPFVLSVLRQVGVALELPFEILIKHFTSSYSAAQAALLEAWRFFMNRRQWLVDNLCNPIYEIWLTEAVANGRVSAPGFLTDPLVRAAYLGADWVGPPRGHIDPVKQNKADGYAEERGWKTGAQNTQERGGNWERNHRQRVKEVNARKADGIEYVFDEGHEEDVEPGKEE
ncbi:phage portal protein [bacterium]|nr:phage portal protein [bacterium]